MMRGHNPTEMRPRRFISDPVDDPFNSSTRENALGPPKASKTSSTVLGESISGMARTYMIRVDRVNMTCVNTICDHVPMDTMGERLRYAREKAGFPSAMAAAKRFGWPTSTYAAHENGQNLIPVDTVKIYARTFKVSAGWLLAREGEVNRSNMVKVAGLVGAGGTIDTSVENLGHEGLDEIELPFSLPEEAIAYRINGDSMWPRYDDGDVIVVFTRPYAISEMLNVPEALVTTADGSRYLKRIVEGSRKDHYDLMSHNAPPMHNVRLQSVAGVHAVVRRGSWRALSNSKKAKQLQQQIKKAKPA
ncbi:MULTISPECIES: S24 family peptidase [unclassified Bradyrhizobium]|uniref:XRE family transcriptional regulator n=1 Tax=unclassified Bradyrhizobium TaxID=2631580 RepID=UPI00143D421B|nr:MULTISPECIES: S24 family peptidase [unclassified Bradyrhizobium]